MRQSASLISGCVLLLIAPSSRVASTHRRLLPEYLEFYRDPVAETVDLLWGVNKLAKPVLLNSIKSHTFRIEMRCITEKVNIA